MEDRGQRAAELEAREDGRIMAREHRVEPVSEYQPIEASGWRNDGGAELAQESWLAAASLKQQAGHPEERLSQKGPTDGGRDLVIDGRWAGLAPYLPQKTTDGGIERRYPKVVTGGARQAVVDRAAVRMQELIYGELVVVDDPLHIGQVPPKSVAVRTVDLLVSEIVAIVPIERELVRDDLESGDDVTPAGPRLPGQNRLRCLW